VDSGRASGLAPAVASLPQVSSSLLAWDRSADYSSLGRFDMLLAADCLFFDDFHLDLLHVLRSLLRVDSGRAWMLAPMRGGSLRRFVQRLQRDSRERANVAPDEPQLCVLHELERYDESIWQQHQSFLAAEQAAEAASASSNLPHVPSYVVDLHYPLLLCIQLASPKTAVGSTAPATA
jgi:calmodulin-lysine N-methyltransferase